MINFTIGQLAKKAGVSVDTIRYYEKIGLLEKAKRSAGNYRHYSEQILSETFISEALSRTWHYPAGYSKAQEFVEQPEPDLHRSRSFD